MHTYMHTHIHQHAYIQARIRERRRSALASGSRTSASIEMSAPKSKGIHGHIRARISASTGVEVESLYLQQSCPECERMFPTTHGLVVHRGRWCRPGQRPASRRGQLASEEEGICCFASTSGHGRRIAPVGLPVRLPRVPFH